MRDQSVAIGVYRLEMESAGYRWSFTVDACSFETARREGLAAFWAITHGKPDEFARELRSISRRVYSEVHHDRP